MNLSLYYVFLLFDNPSVYAETTFFFVSCPSERQNCRTHQRDPTSLPTADSRRPVFYPFPYYDIAPAGTPTLSFSLLHPRWKWLNLFCAWHKRVLVTLGSKGKRHRWWSLYMWYVNWKELDPVYEASPHLNLFMLIPLLNQLSNPVFLASNPFSLGAGRISLSKWISYSSDSSQTTFPSEERHSSWSKVKWVQFH